MRSPSFEFFNDTLNAFLSASFFIIFLKFLFIEKKYLQRGTKIQNMQKEGCCYQELTLKYSQKYKFKWLKDI